jgi:hypothetical protein
LGQLQQLYTLEQKKRRQHVFLKSIYGCNGYSYWNWVFISCIIRNFVIKKPVGGDPTGRGVNNAPNNLGG